jgi:serine/threonine-protein kinase SRPK3
MVFEILGVNFLEIIKRYDYKGVPIPLVRKLARQCLIGLDYLHRMCKIIHTDFKPENVVICLRDDEVEEIAKTGQLTTTKMFNNKADIIKKLNMKIAGTLPTVAATA